MYHPAKIEVADIFNANKEMILELAQDPKFLGVDIGIISILHTWGQNLMYHPHIHSIIPGGGLALDGKSWINSRKDFFLPVEVMSKLFKGKFLCYLKKSYKSKELKFPGNISYLEDPEQFKKLLNELLLAIIKKLPKIIKVVLSRAENGFEFSKNTDIPSP